MDEELKAQLKQTAMVVVGIALLVLATIGGFKAWDRFRPAGETPADTDTPAKRPTQGTAPKAKDDERVSTIRCNPYALHPIEGHPVFTAPVGDEFPIAMTCLDLPAGEMIQITIKGPTAVITETVPLRELNETWTFAVYKVTLTEPGIHTVEYRYKGQLIARYYVEALTPS